MHDNRRTRLVLGVLLVIALALITLDFRDGGASPARNAGADIFGPVERVTHDVTDPVASLFDSITGGPSAQGTIASLQRQNAEIKVTPPNVHFATKMVLQRGGREIDLLFLGRGHTGGDTVVYHPKERIVASTNCGMAPMHADIARAKLVALGAGAKLAREKYA